MQAHPPGPAASLTLQDYLELATECERIAVQIHPSYRQQYADVPAMMHLPPCLANASYDALYYYMEGKTV
jgi:hypothetical protein